MSVVDIAVSSLPLQLCNIPSGCRSHELKSVVGSVNAKAPLENRADCRQPASSAATFASKVSIFAIASCNAAVSSGTSLD